MSPVLIAILLVVAVGSGVATWKAPRLTSVILWALTATIMSMSVLLTWLPANFGSKALWLTLAVPVIWTAYQFWCYWDGKSWRVAGGLFAITCIGGLIIFLTDTVTVTGIMTVAQG